MEMLKMTIGPTRIAPSVLATMAVSAPAINDPKYLAIFGQCLRDLRNILGATDGQSFIIPGTGTMGMEMVAANFVPAGSNVAVLSTGYWGERWAAICQRLGLVVHRLEFPAGEPPDPSLVADLLATKRCQALFVTHVDSSSGVLLDLNTLGTIAKTYGALVLVDGICAAGAEWVQQTAWGIDVYLTSTPKGLGVPAGLVLISVNDQAMTLLKDRSWECRSFALDLKPWIPIMEDAQQGIFGYFQSPAGNLVLGLSKGLHLVLAEGLETRVNRHVTYTKALHAGLEALEIKLLVGVKAARANGVTVCFYPNHQGPAFLNTVQGCGVLLPTGWHPDVATQTFRIGHLGNVTASDIVCTLSALEKALKVPARTGVLAALQLVEDKEDWSGWSLSTDVGMRNYQQNNLTKR